MNEQIKMIKSNSSEQLFDDLNNLKSNADLRVLILSFEDENQFINSDEINEKLPKLITQFSVPLILTIKNTAKDILFEIVLASHICIASDSAKFMIFDKQSLKKHIGSKNLDKLKSIKNEIDAETALDLGIVNKIADKNEIDKEAMRMAEKIKQLAPLALEYCLKAVNQGLEMSLEDALKLETKLFSQVFATEDMREGTSAFMEKRKPVFNGKRKMDNG